MRNMGPNDFDFEGKDFLKDVFITSNFDTSHALSSDEMRCNCHI